MKKTLLIFLLTLMVLLSFAGCGDDGASSNNGGTPDENGTSGFTFVDTVNDYDRVDTETAENFTVSSKKYDYENSNVVLLSVENHGDSNCTVTVGMTYCDEAGTELKTESQIFDGFAAKWQKYFLFDPGITFSNYRYTVSTEDYTGECYGKTFTIRYNGLKEDRVWADEETGFVKGILGDIRYKYEYSEILDFSFDVVFFDNSGKIFKIFNGVKQKNVPPGEEHWYPGELVYGTEKSVEWPDNLKGETSGIIIFNSIVPNGEELSR